MRPWREQLAVLSGPGVLPGVTFGDWLRLLRDNRFRVHPFYLWRAGTITWTSLLNSLARRAEERRCARELNGVEVRPPLFVLGHWRSGTTLLHDLLSVDGRFGCPTLYQVIYPHTFLTTERAGSAFLRMFSPETRPQDNMRLDPATAWEDEFAMCMTGFCSPYLTWAFPGRAGFYDRFLTFRGATPAEVERWRGAFLTHLRKLTLRHGGRPLVLKSPAHTGRVRLLLEMFPGAKFVHIHRDPYATFQSCLHLYEKILPYIRLQRTDRFDWAGRVFRQYNEMYDAFFEERGLIPPGDLHEVGFEELEKDPVGEVRKAYAALGLPDFGEVEPELRRYVASIAGYRKNAHRELPPDLRRRVAAEWRRGFDEWGYAV